MAQYRNLKKTLQKWPIFARQEMKLAIAKLTIEYIFPMLSEVIFHTIPSVIRSRPSVPSEFQLPFFACTWPNTGHLTLSLGSLLHFLKQHHVNFCKNGCNISSHNKIKDLLKVSSSTIIHELLDNANSNNSMMNCAFGMTFWNSKHSFWVFLIVPTTGMFVYKLSN